MSMAKCYHRIFQPTRPLRGATQVTRPKPNPERFQPTRPLRGATSSRSTSARSRRNFNPRAPCGARPPDGTISPVADDISTHAPLAGRDEIVVLLHGHITNFNPRAPCGARHPSQTYKRPKELDFNPRAPCGARLDASVTVTPAAADFNPRAPCGARQVSSVHFPARTRNFNPRAPCGARHKRVFGVHRDAIHFNPRAPCGARLAGRRKITTMLGFQPTRPLRGATAGWAVTGSGTSEISTHAPLAGRDIKGGDVLSVSADFNPRAPCGARRTKLADTEAALDFNPRAPCGARPPAGRRLCP